MSLVPSNWPLNMMSSFLARSLRRTMHAQLEKNIIKNLSAGVNYEYVMIPSSSVPSSHSLSLILFFYIKDWTWEDLRDADLFIEEEVSDNEEAEDEKALEPQSFDEKKAFAKEFAVHLPAAKLVVTGLNEGGVVAIGTGRRGDTSVDDDHFEQGVP